MVLHSVVGLVTVVVHQAGTVRVTVVVAEPGTVVVRVQPTVVVPQMGLLPNVAKTKGRRERR